MAVTGLRVALASSEYPPHVFGGLGVHVDRITAALADRVAYDLFVPRRGDYANGQPAIHMHEVEVPEATNELAFWLRFCQAVALAGGQTPGAADVIHCHDWMTALAGVALRRRLGVPLVLNVHLPGIIGSRLGLENLGLVAADVVIANSQAVRQELLSRGLPVQRIEVIANGVDAGVFRPAPDWPADDGYVLFVGRLVAQKGLDALLQAFGVMLRQCPHSRLVVVGDGDLGLYFKRLARYLGFAHRVSFLDWQIGPALVALYQRAQVVVVPSYYEPFGIVALEALACGRPVVASGVGGLAEIVTDGVQGYLVPAGDYLQLARRLSELARDPERRRRMGAAARARAADFGWDAAAARTMQLYERLAGAAVEPPPPGAIAGVKQALLSGIDDELKAMVTDLLGEEGYV